jgi:hypothetical protein
VPEEHKTQMNVPVTHKRKRNVLICKIVVILSIAAAILTGVVMLFLHGSELEEVYE